MPTPLASGRRRFVAPLLLFCLVPWRLAAQSPGQGQAAASAPIAAGCAGDSTYATLDFWVGDWRVYEGDSLAGTNRIAKVLHGCAVTEDWQDADGSRGQSLFYVEPGLRQWRQVWVTEAAQQTGGLKEKHLIARLPGTGVRFQGELRRPDGRIILDRTTLSPLPGGEVRQLIEISTDGGSTWRPTFDAKYRRAPDDAHQTRTRSPGAR